MKGKTRQEKKELSYTKDRRNNYGANDKASRKAIPMRKALVNKAYRHEVNGVLKQAVNLLDSERVAEVGDEVRSVARSDWTKVPDAPLGEIVKEKLQNRVDHAGRGKTARKSGREFNESLNVDLEKVDLTWVARASDYPHLIASAEEKVRAEEKLRHLAEVAHRNELGEDIRVLIDGEFVTPRLSNA